MNLQTHNEDTVPTIQPVYPEYFADPFVMLHEGTYYAYGTGQHARDGGRAFEVLSSPDLLRWTSHGGALEPVSSEPRDYWAPEVAYDGGKFYMYYSAGIGDKEHHIRVAVSDGPLGPFRDAGRNLTPHELFAIDPHPFRDADGRWYLFFAKDYLEGDRVGTALAVVPLSDMLTAEGEPTTVLRATGDWQVYERARSMYGALYDWHTLEGPFVVHRGGQYHCFYSGGAWTNETYGVGHAVARHPLGPWTEPVGGPIVLRTLPGELRGPGHNSVVMGPDGQDRIVFHAWNAELTHRQMYVAPLHWTENGPTALTSS